MEKISIAIDGPAGAGKSTIAKVLARKLGCIYIDTGAMYRTVALYCIQNNIDFYDEHAVSTLMDTLKIDILYEDNEQFIYLNAKNVNLEIRTDQVAKIASQVATYKAVRNELVKQQRAIKNQKSVVMDGRDIGTVVMPDATLKIFLTASVEERAKRRFIEYQQKGLVVSLPQLTEEIMNRDYQDMNREVSPLQKAQDAIELDTTALSINDIVEQIISLVKEKLPTGEQ